MKTKIGVLLAVAAFAAEKLETQAELLVLKRYPTGWEREERNYDGGNIYFPNENEKDDAKLLELVFLRSGNLTHPIVTIRSESLVNLTNIVLFHDAFEDAGSIDFGVEKNHSPKKLKISVSASQRDKLRVFLYENRKNNGQITEERELSDIVKPVTDGIRIWRVRNERKIVVAWMGGSLVSEHDLFDRRKDDREFFIRDREWGFVIVTPNRDSNLRSHYWEKGFFHFEKSEN